MFLRMAEISKLANLDEILFSYRFHRGSINGRRIVEAQLFNEYAAELWQLRRRRQAQIPYETFRANHSSSRWPASWLFLLDCHSIGQYRQAVAEIYGGRPVQGVSRLAFSMAMSPARTLRRVTRMLRHAIAGSPEPVIYADPVNTPKSNSKSEQGDTASTEPDSACPRPGSSDCQRPGSSVDDPQAHRSGVVKIDV
jgi:hypothetical protein